MKSNLSYRNVHEQIRANMSSGKPRSPRSSDWWRQEHEDLVDMFLQIKTKANLLEGEWLSRWHEDKTLRDIANEIVPLLNRIASIVVYQIFYNQPNQDFVCTECEQKLFLTLLRIGPRKTGAKKKYFNFFMRTAENCVRERRKKTLVRQKYEQLAWMSYDYTTEETITDKKDETNLTLNCLDFSHSNLSNEILGLAYWDFLQKILPNLEPKYRPIVTIVFDRTDLLEQRFDWPSGKLLKSLVADAASKLNVTENYARVIVKNLLSRISVEFKEKYDHNLQTIIEMSEDQLACKIVAYKNRSDLQSPIYKTANAVLFASLTGKKFDDQYHLDLWLKDRVHNHKKWWSQFCKQHQEALDEIEFLKAGSYEQPYKSRVERGA
jgi:hypothetical protein